MEAKGKPSELGRQSTVMCEKGSINWPSNYPSLQKYGTNINSNWSLCKITQKWLSAPSIFANLGGRVQLQLCSRHPPHSNKKTTTTQHNNRNENRYGYKKLLSSRICILVHCSIRAHLYCVVQSLLFIINMNLSKWSNTNVSSIILLQYISATEISNDTTWKHHTFQNRGHTPQLMIDEDKNNMVNGYTIIASNR